MPCLSCLCPISTFPRNLHNKPVLTSLACLSLIHIFLLFESALYAFWLNFNLRQRKCLYMLSFHSFLYALTILTYPLSLYSSNILCSGMHRLNAYLFRHSICVKLSCLNMRRYAPWLTQRKLFKRLLNIYYELYRHRSIKYKIKFFENDVENKKCFKEPWMKIDKIIDLSSQNIYFYLSSIILKIK